MKTLFFIPGTMCNQALWTQVWPPLTALARCKHITIPSGSSTEDIADKIVKQLPTTPIDLIGFSLGGYLAAQVAIRYSERINKLHILSNCPQRLPDTEIRQRERTLKWLDKHHYHGMPLAKIKQMLAKCHHHRDDIITTMQTMERQLGVDMLIDQLRSTTTRETLFDALSQRKLKVKFSYGLEDNLINHPVMNTIINRQHDWQIETLKDCGHMLPLEQPAALAGSIIDWFELNESR